MWGHGIVARRNRVVRHTRHHRHWVGDRPEGGHPVDAQGLECRRERRAGRCRPVSHLCAEIRRRNREDRFDIEGERLIEHRPLNVHAALGVRNDVHGRCVELDEDRYKGLSEHGRVGNNAVVVARSIGAEVHERRSIAGREGERVHVVGRSPPILRDAVDAVDEHDHRRTLAARRDVAKKDVRRPEQAGDRSVLRRNRGRSRSKDHAGEDQNEAYLGASHWR